MKGILNVYKEKNWTSFDVVAYLRKVLGIKKIGHLGTLDPMAEGVLPITIGSATKLFDMFLKKEKTYIAEFEFGYETDTLDATGKITDKNDFVPTLENIEKVIPSFLGEIEQMPPQFSAKKVNGKKACDVARLGGEIELKTNKVFIKDLEIISYTNRILKLKIECGAGTYIRSLCRDVAKKTNAFATMISLERTKVGVFEKTSAIHIKNETKERLISSILPIDFVFSYPKLYDETLNKKLIDGQKIKDLKYLSERTKINKFVDGDLFNMYIKNEFVGLAIFLDGGLKLYKYFN